MIKRLIGIGAVTGTEYRVGDYIYPADVKKIDGRAYLKEKEDLSEKDLKIIEERENKEILQK